MLSRCTFCMILKKWKTDFFWYLLKERSYDLIDVWKKKLIVWRHTQKLGRHRMWFMNILQRLIFPPRTCRILTSAIWDETWTQTYLFWTLDKLTDHLCWKYQPPEKVEFWLKTLTKNSIQFSKPEKLMSNSFFLQKLIFAQKVAQVIRFQSLISDFSLDTSRTWFFFHFWKKVHFLPILWAITRRTFWVLQNGTNLRYQKLILQPFKSV